MKRVFSIIILGLFIFTGCDFEIKSKSNVSFSDDPEYLQTDAHAALDRPYSQAVRVGKMLYLSGVVGRKPGEANLVEGGIVAETRQALENVRTVLGENGSTMENVVKCMCMLADIDDYAAMNAEYAKFFPKNKRPARSTFAVSLPIGARIEIECFATVK